MEESQIKKDKRIKEVTITFFSDHFKFVVNNQQLKKQSKILRSKNIQILNVKIQNIFDAREDGLVEMVMKQERNGQDI